MGVPLVRLGQDSDLELSRLPRVAFEILFGNQHKYDAIIFEEASWQLIYFNKMLFRATNNKIDLGRSATNCYHCRLRVCCVPMFILSNGPD